MVLEATVLCLDSSDFMRNGDFVPTRLQAQRDAANLVVGTKLRDNPESTVGLLSMGQKIDVLSTLTRDKGKVLACLHEIKAAGACDFVSAIQVAQLILKHRQSKNHRQRIIVFVGSPVNANEKQLTTLAKKLKKSNVSVDIISFGEEDVNQAKLESFISTVNKEDNSHLVVVPSGSGRLSDSIMSSPMFATEAAPSGVPAGMGGDLDLENDPELAMALRISLEEERQRQQRAQTEGGEAPTGQEQEQEQQGEGAATTAATGDAQAAPQQQQQQQQAATSQPETQTPAATGGMPNFDAMTEEEMLQYAMQMSLQDQQPSGSEAMDTGKDESEPAAKASKLEGDESAKKAEEEAAKPQEPPKDEAAESAMDIFQDPAYLTGLLGELPGVDPSDAQVQEMLASLAGSAQKDDKKKEGDDDKKKEGDGDK
ncbi:hypothetical protein PTSG_12675 [Salpingoeca rosetta]|uniref:26S proteasome regulatory subunit RPN10 n=1 Tax=Salpingoeca rosetta (strain ATCC 50818 / BSB-021) TaxID=946362 RepID=F2UHT1_SALR5|nr:uncharacterized protein PTSG_12675 [Salpingoeca rosetta]EGD76680.1 hypothetical protein PTSG_12675 [Salpingoeca rosetta]|eukprot:XP_004991052.1 hypothetical protein PTSG_12675 [Salpingoeca rosetta]